MTCYYLQWPPLLVEKGELPEIWSEEVERLGLRYRDRGGVSVEEQRRYKGRSSPPASSAVAGVPVATAALSVTAPSWPPLSRERRSEPRSFFFSPYRFGFLSTGLRQIF
jgi:hypothetical protein